MSKSLSAWLGMLEKQIHEVLGRRQRPARRRNAPPSFGLELLESRQLLTASLGLSHTPICDTPALPQSTANAFKTLSAGEQNAGGKGGSAAAKPPTNTGYAYTVVGNAGDSTVNATSSGLALVGGGTDVAEAFRWMGAKANGGDFVVLRATGTNAYNSYIDGLVPSLDSVATLVISSTVGANDPFVAQKIREAEAIFIAGGDQWDYVRLWNETLMEDAIYEALVRGAPIGGTSAGLAVLSEFDFSAQNGTITSTEALINPFDTRVTLDSGFINSAETTSPTVLRYLDNLVTDSHFQQRDRMGRLVTFMARVDQSGTASDPAPRGLGINEQTALLVEANGVARVVGNAYSKKLSESAQQRAVYLLSATAATAPTMNVTPGQLLTYEHVAVVKADYNPKTGVSDTFDLATWSGLVGVTNYELSVVDFDDDNDTDLFAIGNAGAIY